ncbi:MAG: zf-HC2 domain-containing protein [Planctomycetes bacterium]|nr:zf-HC2 domain-containing protein [Planctomycetota bacterium]
MNCEEMKKLVPAMVLGDLEGAERDRLVEHLKTCEACRAERAHLERTLHIAEKLPAPETSGARRDRVVAAMAAASRDESHFVKPRGAWKRWGIAAAVLLVMAGTVATAKLGFAGEAWELKAEDIRGEALVMKAGGSTWEPLGRGATVHIGDRVLTNGGRVWFRSNAKDLIVLADGSQVMINRQEMAEPSLMLVYGELWAEVTPRDKGHVRFESPEGEGFVEVLGTKLHVEYR